MSRRRDFLRRLPLLLLVLLAHQTTRAQQLDFQRTDSLSQVLLAQHHYRALDSLGRVARQQQATYPALSRRLGTGALAADRPAAALGYYRAALRENPIDLDARAGLVLAYQAFNQTGPATLLAQPLPDSLRQALHLPRPRAIANVEAETSVLVTAERRRGTATYGRLGIGSRLSSRVALSQEVSYYSQLIERPRIDFPGMILHTVRQVQYHALLAVQLTERWQAKAGYDFVSPDQGTNHLGYLALSYAHPYFTVQGGLYAGMLADSARTQTDLRLTVYPLGNLRLYAFGRGSLVGSGSGTFTNGLLGVGGRLCPWLWAEAWAAGGYVPVLAELDGTYVYNLLDPLRSRTALSLLILAARPLTLRLTYGTEQRYIVREKFDYTLHSFTISLVWNW